MEIGMLSKSVCILWLLIYGVQWSAGFVADEISLKAKLLNNSGISTVRPERITLVELSFNLLSVNGLDIKNEQFMVSGWWSMRWKDSRLSWANSAHTDIPVIQVYNSDIWTPALVVDNSVNDLSAIDEDTIPLRVQQNGQVTWNPPGILVLSCDIEVTYFPFDTQTCSIQVTSFGYTIKELNISVHSGLSLTYYQTNDEWNLLRTWNARYEYSEEDYEFAKVSFFVKLQRRATYYGLNTVLPVLLSSLLIPLVFLLPHDAGEKIGYCLTVLLAYVVLLTIVTDGLPTSAKTQSLLGVYIAIVLSLSALAVFLAIHSLYIFHLNPEKPVPVWTAKLTRRVLWLVGCKCTGRKTRSGSGAISPMVSDEDDPLDVKRRRLNRLNHARESIVSTAGGGKRGDGGTTKGIYSSSHFSAEVVEATTNRRDEEGEGEEPMTWHLVAQAYDAFFLRVYFFIIFGCSVALMLFIASNQF